MHKSVRNSRPALAALAACLILSPAMVRAQDATPPAAPPAQSQPKAPTLKLPVSADVAPTAKPAPAPTPLDKAVAATPTEATAETKANVKAREVAEAARDKKAAVKEAANDKKPSANSKSGANTKSGAATPKATSQASPDRSEANAFPVGGAIGGNAPVTSDPFPSGGTTSVAEGAAGDTAMTASAAAASTALPDTASGPTATDRPQPVWPWAAGGAFVLGLAGFGLAKRRRRTDALAHQQDYDDVDYAAPAAAAEPTLFAPAPAPPERSARPIALTSTPQIASGAAADVDVEQVALRAEVARMEAQLRAEAAAAGEPAPIFEQGEIVDQAGLEPIGLPSEQAGMQASPNQPPSQPVSQGIGHRKSTQRNPTPRVQGTKAPLRPRAGFQPLVSPRTNRKIIFGVME